MGRRNRHRKGISIHTPLAGSDRAASGLRGLQAIISIHTPLAGSDAALRKCWRSLIFQSTLPLRGATRPDNWTIWPTGYFNPHSPCGERRGHARHQRHPRHFNPHSPCGERQEDLENFRQLLEFQSTLPLRGATGHCHTLLSGHAISIHTPLAGSDFGQVLADAGNKFQSTLPLRGATHHVGGGCRTRPISIHTPLAGSDAILLVVRNS